LKQVGYGSFEWIELAGAVAASRFLRRRLQVLRESAAANPQMLRNPAQRPLLHQ
jgi:plasmid stabilization system protein ParE